jgi:hypothetical protein
MPSSFRDELHARRLRRSINSEVVVQANFTATNWTRRGAQLTPLLCGSEPPRKILEVTL